MVTTQLRIMTFNIHHCRGTDGLVKMDRIADILRRANPDLVGLNEVDRCFHSRSQYEDQLQYLSRELEMDSAFVPALASPSEEAEGEQGYGNAILSRLPLKKVEGIRLKGGGKAKEPRVLLHGQAEVSEGCLVNLWVSHLSLNPWHHRSQTAEIIQRSLSEGGPSIVLGDWNMRPGSRPWRKVTGEGYRDAWSESRPSEAGATFPSTRPWLRLDYIFVSPEFEVLGAQVGAETPVASDHLPLWADVRLR